jgi:hypothetical protein
MSAILALVGRKSGAPRVAISDASVSASGAGAQGAGYNLSHLGTGSGDGIAGFTWLLLGSASDYEVRATLISGVQGGGFYNIWSNMNTDATWSLTESSIGTLTNVTRIEIRDAASHVILDTADITITATRTS